MGFCKGLGKTYLVAANVVTLLLGLAVIGFSSYALVEFNDLSEYFSKLGLGITIGAGCVVALVSLAGCYGALKQNKCLLAVYTAAMVLTFLVFLSAGIGVAVYKGAFNDISSSTKVADLQSDFQQRINAYELKTYNVCCGQPVVACTPAKTTGCYKLEYKNDYDDFKAAAMCPGLREIKVTNNGVENALVGPEGSPTAGGACGVAADAANPAFGFQKDVNAFIDDNSTYFIAGSITIAVLQLLCLIFSCCLVCDNREEYDPEYAEKMRQQNAGNLTGTQGAAISSNGTNYV